jgi:lipopolysaccharide assembly protein A
MLLLGTLAVVAGGMFALQNPQPVPLDLLVLQLPEQPIAIWVLSAMGVGVMMGLVTGLLLTLRRAATIRRLRKQRDRLLAEMGKDQPNDL